MENEEELNNFNKRWAKLSDGLKKDASNVPIISQSFSYCKAYKTEQFNSMRLSYYNDLINAFKKKELKSFFEHLEATPHIAFITKELRRFLKKELETKNPQSIINVLHSIHSLTLNKYAKPNVYASILTSDSIVTYLFDAKFEQHFGSFSFLIKEIAADILSDLLENSPKKKWAKSFFGVLNDVFNKDNDSEESPLAVMTNLCCQCFYDCSKEHFAHFFAISVYLAVGIKKLSQKFYPSLKACYDYFLSTLSSNSISNQCISKVWDELLLFFEQWIKYYLIEKKPKDYSELDIFIIQLGYVRYRLRYDYVVSVIGYVPCEYPIVPINPDFPPSNKSDYYFSFSYVNFNTRNVDSVIVGDGNCENQDQSDSYCVQTCIESLNEAILNVEEMEIVESEIDEIYKLVSLNDSFLMEKSDLWFEDLDDMYMDVDLDLDVNDVDDVDMDGVDNVDVDVTCEIFNIYDSFVKYDTSYSFSDPFLKFNENFKVPNLETFRGRKEIKIKKGYWSLL